MLLLRRVSYAIFMLLICSVASAEEFVIENIKVNGLQRVSLGTVLSYLPVKVGDTIDTEETADIIHALYKENFFSDISVDRNDDELIINVVERKIIGSLKIVGNKKITDKQLLEALKSVDIFEGQPLDPAVLKAIQQAILSQYHNLGSYDPKVDVNDEPLDRNRVAVTINIDEGPVAKIKSIKIIGNRVFRAKDLLHELSLTTTRFWSFLTNSDQYSREKLDADLEKLRSYYMDRGYIRMTVDDSQATITPDKKGIHIVIKITEGGLYRLKGFSFDGDLIGKRSEIIKLLTLRVGDTFSRRAVHDGQLKINTFLGDHGYGMAQVRPDYDIDEKSKRVWVKFLVIPGHRIYVRHIDFIGNNKTSDEVLRREMRLQESSIFSLSKIEESRRRLANLGYLQDIDYRLAPVPESNNQADLTYDVKETSAITANFQVGYSSKDSFIYGTSLKDQNLFGTGKSLALTLDNTKAVQTYGIGYRNPYFTDNKIGLSVNAYLQRTRLDKVNADLLSYADRTYGVSSIFDMPLSDYSYFSFGPDFEYVSVERTTDPNRRIERFLNKHGTIFTLFKLVSSWGYSNMDRAIFPTNGFNSSIRTELSLPISRRSLGFYKIDCNAIWYLSLFKDFVFRASAEFGYGMGFGKADKLPFFKHFFAGGMGTVRGFEANTIKNNPYEKRATGGSILTAGTASLILPVPNKLKDIVRPSLFIDTGCVYDNYFKFNQLRASYGVQVEWRTPLMPLVFSLAKPFAATQRPWDKPDMFQFSISAGI